VVQKNQNLTKLRIIIEQPVIGVLYSLQATDESPPDPKGSRAGEALGFDFRVRMGPGPKFFGDQVRREGRVRRFVPSGAILTDSSHLSGQIAPPDQ